MRPLLAEDECIADTNLPMPAPLLKWAGGKRQLLPELHRLRPPSAGPKRFTRYFEPFLGGGAFFFDLFGRGLTGAFPSVLNDINEEIIHCYRTVRDKPYDLIRCLKHYSYTEKTYYAVREQDPAKLDNIVRAARTIYLNRTCFNGLYRVNKQGKFNVPFGRYTNPTICDAENIHLCSAALQNAKLLFEDFDTAVFEAKEHDFVYLDPPYVPLSKTSNFASYAKDGFSLRDQERLAKSFRALAERGVYAMLSNSDTEIVRDLYAGFDIQTVSAKRAVNSKAEKRGVVSEVIVRSWVKA